MKFVFLATALVLLPHLYGQEPTCPVQVKGASIQLRTDMASWVQFRNLTDKRIESVKFNVIYLDKTQDPHPSFGDLVTDTGVKPGKVTYQTWTPSYLNYSQGGGGYIIRVDKILYKDGTAWKAPNDDASNPCLYKKIESSYVASPY
jgi:hypothetical protein